MNQTYKSTDCLSLCVDLQLKANRWGVDLAIGELMEMAVKKQPSEIMVIAVCRLLFVAKDGEELRGPGLGIPSFLGGTSEVNWPLQPVHLHNDLPFLIVENWLLSGMPEHPTWYLAYCLRVGQWNRHQYKMIDPEQADQATQGFLTSDLWVQSLSESEREFLVNQTT